MQAAWGTRATPGGGAGGGLAPGRCCGGGGGGGKRGGRHLDAAVTSEVDGGGEVAAHQPAEGVKPEREGAGGGGQAAYERRLGVDAHQPGEGVQPSACA